jgi:anaerobic dimethyl sulfoxide reductase subunit B (iron-sulfur subunit)
MTNRQLAFVVDTTRCINCKTCEIACKDINGAGPGVRIRKVRSFEWEGPSSLVVMNISMSCNHCEDPLCAKHCPAKAYHKRDDGIVMHDAARCIGCRYCTWVCPYGAPQYDEANGCIRKCDLCSGQLELGKTPACVEACPTRAIAVRWMDELTEETDQTIDIRNLPAAEMTRPNTRYRVRREAHND